MSTTTAAVTGHNDLLSDFKDWIIATAGWTELDRIPTFGTVEGVDKVSEFSDETGDTTTTLFVANTDEVIVGATTPFTHMTFDLSTLGSLTITPTWEIWNGSAWVSLTVTDGTSGMTADGVVSWTMTAASTWALDSGYYKVRITRTQASAITSPVVDTIGLSRTKTGTWPVLDADTAEFSFQAPGSGANQEVYLNIRSVVDVSLEHYSLEIRLATGYGKALDFNGQPGSSASVFLNLDKTAMTYWFYANDRRAIIVAKQTSGAYMSAYMGLMLPFALPAEYPKALYLAASYPNIDTHDNNPSALNTRNRSIADPGQGTAYMLPRSVSTWVSVENHTTGTTDVKFTSTPDAMTWPHRSLAARSTDADWAWEWSGLERMRPNLNGEMPIFPVHVFDTVNREFGGVLEGVFSIPGSDKSAELALSIGAQNFRCFPGGSRTSNHDYFAVETL